MKKFLSLLLLFQAREFVAAQDKIQFNKVSTKQLFLTTSPYWPEKSALKVLTGAGNKILQNNLSDYYDLVVDYPSRKYHTEWNDRMVEKDNNLARKNKSQADSRFFIKIYGGEGFLSPGSYRIQSTSEVSYQDQNNVPHDTTIKTQGNKGIGGGWRLGGGIGFVINDFLNVGVDIEYQKGKKLKNSLNTTLDQYDFSTSDDEIHYKAITLTPYIIFKALARPDYFIYNKLGVLFTLPYTLYNSGTADMSYSRFWPAGPTDSANSSLSSTSIATDIKTKLSLGIGFNVAFGVNYRLNKKFRIFGELFGNFSSLIPSHSETTTVTDLKYAAYLPGDYDYTTNPITVLYYNPAGFEQINHAQDKTTYHKGGATTRIQDSYIWNLGDPNFYTTSHGIDKRFTVNMNVIGINCGIIYRF